jgi:hypothetical protein
MCEQIIDPNEKEFLVYFYTEVVNIALLVLSKKKVFFSEGENFFC